MKIGDEYRISYNRWLGAVFVIVCIILLVLVLLSVGNSSDEYRLPGCYDEVIGWGGCCGFVDCPPMGSKAVLNGNGWDCRPMACGYESDGGIKFCECE